MSNKWKKICEHLSQKLNVKISMKSQQLRKNLTKMIAKDMLSTSSENQALYTYIKWVEWHLTWNDNYIQFHVLNCIRTFKNWERFVFFWNFYSPFGPLYWYLTGGTKGKTYLDLSKCCNWNLNYQFYVLCCSKYMWMYLIKVCFSPDTLKPLTCFVAQVLKSIQDGMKYFLNAKVWKK